MSQDWGQSFFNDILGKSSATISDFFRPTESTGDQGPTPLGKLPPDSGINSMNFMQNMVGDPFAGWSQPSFGMGGGNLFGGGDPVQALLSVMPQFGANPGIFANKKASMTPETNTAAAVQGPIAQAIARKRAAAAPSGNTNTGGAGGTISVGESDLVVDTSSPYYARAVEIAKEEGVDPTIFTRLIQQESQFVVKAYNPSGASGLTQLMPDTARGLGVTDVQDPEQSMRGGAKYLKQMLNMFNNDYRVALQAYNAGPGNAQKYGGNVPFAETRHYLQRILGTGGGQVQAATPAASSANPYTGGITPDGVSNELPSPPPGVRPLKDITTFQYGAESLATGAADWICGPIAAQAFARANGKNPTLAQSFDMARSLGIISEEKGMFGIQATASLIRSLGGKAEVGAQDDAKIQSEIAAGRPVIINTSGHYFVIEGVIDAARGIYDFGNSARALKASGGNTAFTLGSLSSLGFGAAAGAIYAR